MSSEGAQVEVPQSSLLEPESQLVETLPPGAVEAEELTDEATSPLSTDEKEKTKKRKKDSSFLTMISSVEKKTCIKPLTDDDGVIELTGTPGDDVDDFFIGSGFWKNGEMTDFTGDTVYFSSKHGKTMKLTKDLTMFHPSLTIGFEIWQVEVALMNKVTIRSDPDGDDPVEVVLNLESYKLKAPRHSTS